MFILIFLTFSSVHSTLAAVISPILAQESTNGIVYIPAGPVTNPTSLSLPSALSTPAILGAPTTSSSVWPASITYVAQSSSVPVVGVAFVTTVNGTSKITTTQPPQSLILPTASGYSLIAIEEGGNTTTLTLNSLPTATLPTEPAGVQIVTQSGIPVTYSPITLSGYNNTEPVEISTIFTETVSGTTTTQGGWYVLFLSASGVGSNLAPSPQIIPSSPPSSRRINTASLKRILTSTSTLGGLSVPGEESTLLKQDPGKQAQVLDALLGLYFAGNHVLILVFWRFALLGMVEAAVATR